jgi:hypothetical protein
MRGQCAPAHCQRTPSNPDTNFTLSPRLLGVIAYCVRLRLDRNRLMGAAPTGLAFVAESRSRQESLKGSGDRSQETVRGGPIACD